MILIIIVIIIKITTIQTITITIIILIRRIVISTTSVQPVNLINNKTIKIIKN